MTTHHFEGRRVLFLDDDSRWLRILEKWFDGAPYDCVFFDSPFAALQEIEKNPVDVIVTDMSMPVVDGLHVLNEARNKSSDSIRIVMSGHFDISKAIEAINKGEIFRYIVKPCKNKDVKYAVYQALLKVDQRESASRRAKESSHNKTQRIKKMAQSISDLESCVSVAHDCLINIFQEVVLQTGGRKVVSERNHRHVKRFLSRLDVVPEVARQIEIVSIFEHLAYDTTASLNVNERGDLVFQGPDCEDPEALSRIGEILDDLNLNLAAQILESRSVAGGNQPDLSADDNNGVAVAVSLLMLANDFSTLVEEYGLTEQQAIKKLSLYDERYGRPLFAEVFVTDYIAGEVPHVADSSGSMGGGMLALA